MPDLPRGRRATRSLCRRRRDEFDRPIGVWPEASCAVMPGDKVDGRRVRFPAALATQALDEVFKGHVAPALDQQAHRVVS
jgi:hypothetical protein